MRQQSLTFLNQAPKKFRVNTGAAIAVTRIESDATTSRETEVLAAGTKDGESIDLLTKHKNNLHACTERVDSGKRTRKNTSLSEFANGAVDPPSSPTKPEHGDPTSADSCSDAPQSLNLHQRVRCEVNRALAIGRQTIRICEARVAQCKEKGLTFPELEDLLVEKSWQDALPGELRKAYAQQLQKFLSQESSGKVPVYPPPQHIFRALNSCPFDQVKLVIIGQDPYHGPGQAMGLSFSVPEGLKRPSSLQNIYREINADVGCSIPEHGNLEKWAAQGVLLLNSVLTVRAHQANSHARKGWEPFTDAVIRALVQRQKGVIFLLWGAHAQEKCRMISPSLHHILKAPHPSGLSAHRGFIGCKHFSKANALLVDMEKTPIDWQL